MKGFGDMHKMLKQAQEMQARLQKEMAELRVEGASGGGMVAVTVDGAKNVIALKLDPEVVNKDDVDMLNDAATKVDEHLAGKLGGLGAGLKIPGLS
jgi:DNA-binding YbaB/EbfC family protein